MKLAPEVHTDQLWTDEGKETSYVNVYLALGFDRRKAISSKLQAFQELPRYDNGPDIAATEALEDILDGVTP